MNLVGLLIL